VTRMLKGCLVRGWKGVGELGAVEGQTLLQSPPKPLYGLTPKKRRFGTGHRTRTYDRAMTADGRAKADVVTALPFRQTIRPLVMAPAGALAVIGILTILEQNVGPYLPIALLLTAPFVYAAETIFVLPLIVLWPKSRRPNLAIGAIWGASVAWAFVLVLQAVGWVPARVVALPSTWREWQEVGRLCLPGIASGVLFAYLSRK
jgi:hypothetical protein